MLKNQKYKLSRKATLAVVTATLLTNIVAAHATLPNTPACNSLTRANIAAFRLKVGTETTGAIALLKKANLDGEAARDPVKGVGGGANSPLDLLVIASRIDEKSFLAPACKSIFYPSLPQYGSSAGDAVPNNIHACFRVHVTPELEHAMYAATLHAWNNKVGLTSRGSAVDAFYVVRNLLRESRKISNNAQTCIFQSTGDPVLVGP
ncbi:MAG: hypothetical protein ABL933_12725 [Methyloglobulus sp.]|nr:hypothetical protein [Methyloglobulus sp.]